jgi:uncharacterized protein (DUF1697 family)
MEQLRTLFVAMGFSDVETFIASGNVIFRTNKSADVAALEREIEARLEKALGYPVGVFLRSIREVHAIADYQPFTVEDDPTEKISIYVILLAERPSAPAKRAVFAYRSATDDFAIRGREIYWLCRKSMLDSPFATSRVESNGGNRATMRNRNTMLRLAKKYPI